MLLQIQLEYDGILRPLQYNYGRTICSGFKDVSEKQNKHSLTYEYRLWGCNIGFIINFSIIKICCYRKQIYRNLRGFSSLLRFMLCGFFYYFFFGGGGGLFVWTCMYILNVFFSKYKTFYTRLSHITLLIWQRNCHATSCFVSSCKWSFTSCKWICRCFRSGHFLKQLLK